VVLTTALAACAAQPGAESVDERTQALEPDFPTVDDESGAEEVLALVERGVDLWQASCDRPSAEGLCLEFVAGNEDPSRCGSPVLGGVRVHARDADAAREAQADFAEALELALDVDPPEDDALQRRYKTALAVARLSQVDAELETYFAIEAPTDIDFTVEDWKRTSDEPKFQAEYVEQVRRRDASVERFKEYFETKTLAGQELMTGFAGVKQFGDLEIVLQAALRTSWVSVHFHDQITTFEVPASIRDRQEARVVYCDALADHAERPRQLGLGAASYCHEHASAAGLEGGTAQACADLLTKLEPAANESSQ